MRLKTTMLWATLSALLMVAVVFLAQTRRDADPILAGRPISQWLGVLEKGQAASVADYNKAYDVLFETTNHRAALQAQILDRIEAAYSPSAKLWQQAYASLPAKVSARLPQPRFGHINPQTVLLLDGIMPEPSPRQRAAIEKLLGDTSPDNSWLISSALRVGLSPSTQTVPDAMALLRQQLAAASPNRRFLVCGTICNQHGLEGWRNHREVLSGLVADLWKLTTAPIGIDGREAARRALDRLPRDLENLGSAAAPPLRDTSPESPRLPTTLFDNPVHSAHRTLALEAPETASNLSLQLAPTVPAAWTDTSDP